MFWRLLFVPLVLALALLVLSVLISGRLGENEKHHIQLIQQQSIENISLKLGKVFVELRSNIEARNHLYEPVHAEIQQRLDSGDIVDLQSLKSEYSRRLGFEVDLYLINPDFVVTSTTFQPDLGLDFKQPFFQDAQASFKLADQEGGIVLGRPTQEFISREYKLYTLSALSAGGYLEIGFIDPRLKELFDQAQSVLENTFGVEAAELYEDNWASFLSPLTRFSSPEANADPDLPKSELMVLAKQRLHSEYQVFQGVTPNHPVILPVSGQDGVVDIYIELDRHFFTPDIMYRYVAKVREKLPTPVWLDEHGDTLAGVIVMLVMILLVFALYEIRVRVIRPLEALIRALHINRPVKLDENSKIPAELRFLMDSYNHYHEQMGTLTHQLRESASTDPLTGLYNRSILGTIHSRLCGIARRNQHFLAVAFIDLDHFKEFNDLYGHPTGDRALIQLADLIRELFQRPTDAAIRYGGEEFLIYFDTDSFAGAKSQAERLRRRLEKQAIPHKGNPPLEVLTLSMGLVVINPQHDVTLDKLISTADKALYMAKNSGRNKVVSNNMLDTHIESAVRDTETETE